MDKSRLQKNLKSKLHTPAQPTNNSLSDAVATPTTQKQGKKNKADTPQTIKASALTRSVGQQAGHKKKVQRTTGQKQLNQKKQSKLSEKKEPVRKQNLKQSKSHEQRHDTKPTKLKKNKKSPHVQPLAHYIPLIIWYCLAVLIVLLDQMTKLLASSELIDNSPFILTSWLQFDLVHNPGAAFSLFAEAGGWQRPFLVLISFAVSVFLIIWLARLPSRLRLLPLALTLLLGGAIGNLIDRIISGYVVDFISVHYQELFFPSFNIADSAISIGAFLLFIDLFVGSEAKAKQQPATMNPANDSDQNPHKEHRITVDELLREAQIK